MSTNKPQTCPDCGAVGEYINGPLDDHHCEPPLAHTPAPMSEPNRLIAYSAAQKLRDLGYSWDDRSQAWVKPKPKHDKLVADFARACAYGTVEERATLGRQIEELVQAKQPLSPARVAELCTQLTMEPYQVHAVERALGVEAKP